MAAQGSSKKGGFKKIGSFFKGVKSELKKVNWPNKKELTTYTIVVFSVCLLISLIVWLLDSAFIKLISLIA